MDENWLRRVFAPTQALVSCKVIRHKTTQMSRGYGFLLFNSPEAAEQVLSMLNGTQIPGTDQIFRLNLAANGRQGNSGPTDFSLFVGDLSEEVTDYMLQEAFKQYYRSVRSAKVMRAPLSGKSRNFGFCRFASEQERDQALVDMNGKLQICGKPVRVSLATAKKSAANLPALTQPTSSSADHTTILIRGLPEHVTEADLHRTVAAIGNVVSIKLWPAEGCAVVQFKEQSTASLAMAILQKQVLGGSPMQVTWVGQGPGGLPPIYNEPLQQSTYDPELPSGSLDGLFDPGLSATDVPGLGPVPLGTHAASFGHLAQQPGVYDLASSAGYGWPGALGYHSQVPPLGQAGLADLERRGRAHYLTAGRGYAVLPHVQGAQMPTLDGLPTTQPGFEDLRRHFS